MSTQVIRWLKQANTSERSIYNEHMHNPNNEPLPITSPMNYNTTSVFEYDDLILCEKTYNLTLPDNIRIIQQQPTVIL